MTMAKKSYYNRLREELAEITRKEQSRRGPKSLFSRGRKREIMLELERLEEERRAKRSAAARKGSASAKLTKEYNQLRKALQRMQKQGKTLMEIPEARPKSLEETRKLAEAIKQELKSIAAETRLEAKYAGSDAEKKRLEIKAKLDETWGPERDKLVNQLEDMNKEKKKASEEGEAAPTYEELYSRLFGNDDFSERLEEEPEPEEEEEDQDNDLGELPENLYGWSGAEDAYLDPF